MADKSDQASRDRCVVLFVKCPGEGDIKTRLAQELPGINVVTLYENFVRDVLATLQEIKVSVIVSYMPDHAEAEVKQWLGNGFEYFPQKGYDLGERMKNSFLHAFAKGFERVIVMGSDIPDLPGQFIAEAFSSLAYVDSVIGPCSDGGYYLIGFRRGKFLERAFEAIPWSTGQVFEETRRILVAEGRRCCFLPLWSDVDTAQDLKVLVLRGNKSPFKHSHTMTFLNREKFCM